MLSTDIDLYNARAVRTRYKIPSRAARLSPRIAASSSGGRPSADGGDFRGRVGHRPVGAVHDAVGAVAGDDLADTSRIKPCGARRPGGFQDSARSDEQFLGFIQPVVSAEVAGDDPRALMGASGPRGAGRRRGAAVTRAAGSAILSPASPGAQSWTFEAGRHQGTPGTQMRAA